MSPVPELHPNNADWLSKRDSARLVGVSERQIDRQAAAGRIRSRHEPRQPHQKAAPVFFAREDLEAIKAGRPNYYPVVEKSPSADAGAATESKAIVPAQGHREAVTPAGLGVVIERIAHLLGPARPEPKPWLSVPEAAEYSGLPAAYVRYIARVLADRGDAINLASSGARPRWKIRRAALEAPLRVAPSEMAILDS